MSGIPEQRFWNDIQVGPELQVRLTPEIFDVMQVAATENVYFDTKHATEPDLGDMTLLRYEKPQFAICSANSLGRIASNLRRFADSTDYSVVEKAIECPVDLQPLLSEDLATRRQLGAVAEEIAGVFEKKAELLEGIAGRPIPDADEWFKGLLS
ncbi:MAG TPA: hypothetical protein VK983_03495 [Candidatus Limnocylindrales bacterium]|nr:hypothetical protein [Candidatus Limnocylindrales bacterium]